MPELDRLLVALLGILGNLSITLLRVERGRVEINFIPTTAPVTDTARLLALIAGLSALIVPGANVDRVDISGDGVPTVRLVLPPA